MLRYEVQKLISPDFGDPHQRYGLLTRTPINLSLVSPSASTAGHDLSAFIDCASFPVGQGVGLSWDRIGFKTPAMKDSLDSGIWNVQVRFSGSSARTLCGSGSIVVILDEFAYMREPREVYYATIPATAHFSPRDSNGWNPTAPLESRILVASTPSHPDSRKNGQGDYFHDLFSVGMKDGNSLSLQIPTWELNPHIPASEYQRHFERDQLSFFVEFGAVFVDRIRC
jgi:hypothetical protein